MGPLTWGGAIYSTYHCSLLSQVKSLLPRFHRNITRKYDNTALFSLGGYWIPLTGHFHRQSAAGWKGMYKYRSRIWGKKSMRQIPQEQGSKTEIYFSLPLCPEISPSSFTRAHLDPRGPDWLRYWLRSVKSVCKALKPSLHT